MSKIWNNAKANPISPAIPSQISLSETFERKVGSASERAMNRNDGTGTPKMTIMPNRPLVTGRLRKRRITAFRKGQQMPEIRIYNPNRSGSMIPPINWSYPVPAGLEGSTTEASFEPRIIFSGELKTPASFSARRAMAAPPTGIKSGGAVMAKLATADASEAPAAAPPTPRNAVLDSRLIV